MKQASNIWYKNPWILAALILGGLISLPLLPILAPIGAIALIWTQKKWGRGIKIGGTIATVIVGLFLLSFYATPSPETGANEPIGEAVSTETTEQDTESGPEGDDNSTRETDQASQLIEQDVKDNSATTNESKTDLYEVTAVVDGDTFKVSIDENEETLRLIGIDTPETVDPRKSVQCFGVEASNRAKELLAGKRVRLEADASQGERDKYGRLLRYAFLEDGRFFNKLMISDGYAREYTYDSAYKYQAEFKQAEIEAKTAKRGLWADDACITTTEPAPEPSSSPTPTPTSAPSPEPTPEPTPNVSTGHTFYTSSHHSAKFYYCDTDDGWKSLSASYLKSFSSAEQLLAKYPNRVLHEPCK